MAAKVSLAFDINALVVPLDMMLPLRKITESIRESEKYLSIKASLKEIGLIEPLIVFPEKGRSGQYYILDGVIRWDALKSLGERNALCLKATDDDTFTYNHKVSRITPIQEHFMILRAIERGVSEERIASTLHVNVSAIKRKRDLLVGICPEAVDLLRDKRVSPAALREVKRVVPMRQVEMAELMIAANNYTASHAKCLYFASTEEQRLPEQRSPEKHGLAPEDALRMQRETQSLLREYKAVEETHSDNVLNLVPAVGYLKALLGNSRVERYLRQHFPDLRAEFVRLLESPELA